MAKFADVLPRVGRYRQVPVLSPQGIAINWDVKRGWGHLSWHRTSAKSEGGALVFVAAIKRGVQELGWAPDPVITVHQKLMNCSA